MLQSPTTPHNPHNHTKSKQQKKKLNEYKWKFVERIDDDNDDDDNNNKKMFKDQKRNEHNEDKILLISVFNEIQNYYSGKIENRKSSSDF